MFNHSKKIILAIFVLLLIVIFWRFGTLLYFPDAGDSLEKGNATKLEAKETLSENFNAERNGLAKIELILRSPGLQKNDALYMRIMDENCQNIVHEGELRSSYLSSNNLYEFAFPRLTDSAGKKYCLEMTFDPKKASAKPLQFFYQEDPAGSFKNVSTDETFSGQSLSFRLAYKNAGLWQNLTELNQRVSQYKPWFLKRFFLASIAVAFFILSVILIVIFIFV